MRVGIGLKVNAYTPEAYAYARHLSSRGNYIQLEHESLLDLDNDINIYFMGVRPFWKKKPGCAIEVHEYQSLSTPPLANAKDLLKRKINGIPSGRIFLNNIVSRNLRFSDAVPFIYRDMGVDNDLFQKPVANPRFDIVYSGSIAGRVGLLNEIRRLALLGFRILVVGEVAKEVRDDFSLENVCFVGRVKREELAGLYAECRAGLNYTPDIYPFNLQTSTKTLEYLASGLIVLSNSYPWARNFSEANGFKFMWLDGVFSRSDLDAYSSASNSSQGLRHFSWDNILNESDFEAFLTGLLVR